MAGSTYVSCEMDCADVDIIVIRVPPRPEGVLQPLHRIGMRLYTGVRFITDFDIGSVPR